MQVLPHNAGMHVADVELQLFAGRDPFFAVGCLHNGPRMIHTGVNGADSAAQVRPFTVRTFEAFVASSTASYTA